MTLHTWSRYSHSVMISVSYGIADIVMMQLRSWKAVKGEIQGEKTVWAKAPGQEWLSLCFFEVGV